MLRCFDFAQHDTATLFRAGRPNHYIDAIHLQKVISKRNPAPFEQQRVSVPIEEQEQKCLSVCAIRWWECVKRVLLFPRLERQTQATICFANRQYRQHIVVRSADAVCTARDAIRRYCQRGGTSRSFERLPNLLCKSTIPPAVSRE